MFRTMVPWMERMPRPVMRLEREMEDLWDRFFGQDEWPAPANGFAPRCDVVETGTHFEVRVDLPGMKPEDFHVELKEGELWITGRTEEQHEEEGKTYHRVERHYGEFRRVIPLPGKVAADKVEARYHDGVLAITIPKAEEAKARRIDVKAECAPEKKFTDFGPSAGSGV